MGRYEDRLYIRSNIDYYKGELDRCYSEMNSLKSDMERVRSNITYFSDEIESFIQGGVLGNIVIRLTWIALKVVGDHILRKKSDKRTSF